MEEADRHMKQRRYTEDQIVRILGEVESGKSVAAAGREYGVAETTIHRWRKRYGGMSRSELRRLKELESENARLKRIVAQQALDIDALKDVLGKEW
jgi:putative transposase